MKKCSIGLIFVLSFLFFNLCPAAMAATQQIRLIIFPFQNLTQNKADDWIGNGFAETLTSSLASVQDLVILERSQLKNILSEQTLGQTGYVDQKTAVEMGKILNANVVVVGSFQKVNNQIRINSRFVDIETGQVQKDHIADIQGQIDDVFTLQNQLADKIIQSFNVKISQAESQKINQNIHSTDSVNAYEEYIKGKECLNQMKVSAYPRALEYFQKSVKADPGYALSHSYLSITASMVAEQGKMLPNINTDEYKKLAGEHANKALKLNPDLPEAHRAMAYIYLNDKNKDKAAEEIKKALQLNPKDIESAVFYLTTISSADFDKRLDELEKYLSVDKDNPQLLITIGSLYFTKTIEAVFTMDENKKKEYSDQAIFYFEQILKTYPDNYTAHLMLSSIYGSINKTEPAEQHIKKAISLEPDSFLSYFQAGSFYMQTKNYPQAEQAFKKAIEINPDYPLTYSSLGSIYLMQKKNDLALDILTKAVKYNPKDENSYFTLYFLKMQTGKLDEAEATIKEGLNYNPDSFSLHFVFGTFYVSKATTKPELYDEAIKEFQKALSSIEIKEAEMKGMPFFSTIKASIYSQMGKVYKARNKLENALIELKKAKEILAQQPDIYEDIADICIKTDKINEAIPNLQKAAELYLTAGRFDEAISNIKKLTELNPNDFNEYYNLGNAYLHIKQLNKAETALKKAIELKPDYVKAHYNLGVVYWQLGKYKEAADSWETTLKFDSANQNAKEWLQKAKNNIK